MGEVDALLNVVFSRGALVFKKTNINHFNIFEDLKLEAHPPYTFSVLVL